MTDDDLVFLWNVFLAETPDPIHAEWCLPNILSGTNSHCVGFETFLKGRGFNGGYDIRKVLSRSYDRQRTVFPMGSV